MKHTTRLSVFNSLSPKRRRAATELVTANKTQREIASEIGVTEFTLSTWKHDDDFIKAMRELSSLAFEDYSSQAVRVMSKLLDAESEQVRFKAAAYVIDRTLQTDVETADSPGIDWAKMVRETERIKQKQEHDR